MSVPEQTNLISDRLKQRSLLILTLLLSVCAVTYVASSFSLIFSLHTESGGLEDQTALVRKPSSRLNALNASRPVLERCRGGSKWCEDVDSALKAVYDHQNPKDCSKAKFFVYEEWPFGLGSAMGIKSGALACAIKHQRVLIILNGKHPEGWSSCPLDSMDCVFMPLTKCTREDVLRGASPDTLPTWTELNSNQEAFDKARVVALGTHILSFDRLQQLCWANACVFRSVTSLVQCLCLQRF